jgi:alpha-tubulin suppressor-like RCC1 family protein
MDVYCWGANDSGQLGLSPGPDVAQPTHVAAIAARLFPGAALAAGRNFTCVLDAGIPRCFGANDVGQLGRGEAGAPSVEQIPALFEGPM